jgi:hypothetical protein
MTVFILKLFLTPALIALVSLAGRRWGSSISGWLIGLPLTSGPVAFFLALNQGNSFAAAAAVGILGGTLSQVVFSLAYSWVALRHRWQFALLVSSIIFFIATAVLQALEISAFALYVIVVLSLLVGLWLMPKISAQNLIASPAPPWDIPARMIVATSFVLILTSIAPLLGAHLTGLLSPFPLYAATLAAFAHHFDGAATATRVLRGMLIGLFSFASFFLVLAFLLESSGVAVAFIAAIIVALAIQGGSLLIMQRAKHT